MERWGTESVEPTAGFEKNVPAIETHRILLGFMSEEAAIRKLQSTRTVGSPVDPLNRPLTGEEPSDIETAYAELWEDAKNSIDSQNPFESSDAELTDLPDEEGVKDHIDAFVNTPHCQASLLGTLPEDRWDIKMVPIENLVSFQPAVTKTAFQQDIPTATESIRGLLHFSLPVDTIPLVEDQRIEDSYFTGWQFVTRSPNIYVTGPYHSRLDPDDLDADDTAFATVSFDIHANPNFVYVAHFEDRYILKNGYHRTYQLLRAGETHVPAAVIEADTYQETGGEHPGFFDREIVMGERPPMVTDYETPIAIDIDRRAMNKVIRIIAETTDILR
ncbi:MAG TPA: hypothetical protein VFJ06_09370 [Halococcus sp.]|nr:hypothetical protein [Halococcus sp.]